MFAALRINEIYPAPPAGGSEWVEIYNPSSETVELTQYKLTDLSNKGIRFTEPIIGPLGFALATSSAVLNNDGDTVLLKNLADELVDIATYSGSFNAEKSAGRCPDGMVGLLILHVLTKGLTNNPGCPVSPTPAPVPTVVPEVTKNIVTYDNIHLSEAMPNPEEGKEWVEIYNGNSFPISLVDWYIDDIENGGATPKKFSLDIPANGFAVIELISAIFNNDGDTVRLLDTDKKEKDSFEYGRSEKGRSLSRQNLGDEPVWCTTGPSPHQPNHPCPVLTVPTPRITTAPNGLVQGIMAVNKPVRPLPGPTALKVALEKYGTGPDQSGPNKKVSDPSRRPEAGALLSALALLKFNLFGNLCLYMIVFIYGYKEGLWS